jgi:hypothetical protein
VHRLSLCFIFLEHETMKQYELTHTNIGEVLCRLMDKGWSVMQNPLGGGHADSRGTGGWWLYKGDELMARKDQEEQFGKVKARMDAHYSQPWV